MMPRILVGAFVLLMLIASGPAGAAVMKHNFDCKQCHDPAVVGYWTTLGLGGENICLRCHTSAGDAVVFADSDPRYNGGTGMATSTHFVINDSSDALGSTTAAGLVDPSKQTSHFWAGDGDKPEAGALPAITPKDPGTPLYTTYYQASAGKVYCSVCHDPHGGVATGVEDTSLFRLATAEEMCQNCHRNWIETNATNTDAHATHPLVTDYYNSVFLDTGNGGKNETGKYKNFTASGDMALVNGDLGCSTCHGLHWTDSDSTTPDGPGIASDGDGHLLRADGPTETGGTQAETAQRRSNLCQACHTYEMHGKVGSEPDNDLDGLEEQVGCLVCHGGHSYNATLPNYFVLNRSVQTAAFGAQTTLYTANPTDWETYCTSCHGPVAGFPTTLRAHTPGEGCTGCHAHDATGYSFAMGDNASICGDCHGSPPRDNSVAVRGDSTVDTGVADGPNANDDYITLEGVDAKDELLTPHKRHAGALNADKVAVDYAFGSSGAGLVSACNPCHNDQADAVAPPSPTHDTGISAGSFRDIYFDDFSTRTGMFVPNYETVGWTCDNVYCHSNGGKRNATGTKVFGDFTTTQTPSWEGGSNNTTNVGSLIGDPNECQSCHGDTAATMDAAGKDNSPTHKTHLTKLVNDKTSCYLCHADTVDATGVVPATARDIRNAGTHVNGAADVAFGGFASGSYTGGAVGSCAVYCHNPSITDDVSGSPDWDSYTGSDLACDACHEGKDTDTVTIDTGAHTVHLYAAGGPLLGCAACHDTGADAGTHTGHVDGTPTVVVGICDTCHGVEDSGPAWDVTPDWNDPASEDCRTCHAGITLSPGTGTAAPDMDRALSLGHNLGSGTYASGNDFAAKDCTDCHDLSTGTHFDGTNGNATLLKAGFDCLSCHGLAGSAGKNDIVSHQGKACTVCHDPHGDGVNSPTPNIYMVRADSADFHNSGLVAFSGKTGDDSYDEDDGADGRITEANDDDLCATCHSSVNLTTHNNWQNSDDTVAAAGHNMGDNCFTSCHLPHTEATGAFGVGAGTSCNQCHGNPPTTVGEMVNGGNPGAHAKHASSASHQIEDGFPNYDVSDCAVCHENVASYGYGKSGTHQDGSTNGDLKAGISNDGCTAACHASTPAGDGSWSETLSCAGCHYYALAPVSGDNDTGRTISTGSHNRHFDKQKACTDCHADNTLDTAAPRSHMVQTGADQGAVLVNKATPALDEATILAATLGTGSDSDPGNATCAGAGVGLGCHNTKTSPAWGGTVTCSSCHTPAGGATADPTTGLHKITASTPQVHDATLNVTNKCEQCHTSLAALNSHADGNWEGDLASNTESRGLFATYTEASTSCTATTCHSDGGNWGRLWSTDADSDATASGSARCNVCHGQYDGMTNGTGWTAGTSHAGTFGGSASSRGETHNSQTGENNACEDCHSYTTLAGNHNTTPTHEITMNDDAVDIIVTESGGYARCAKCHVTGDPLVDGTYTFTQSIFPIQRVAGANDPKAECNSCHGVGGNGRYWPVGTSAIDDGTENNSGRHEIHMLRLTQSAYPNDTVPGDDAATILNLLTNNSTGYPALDSKTKQLELCSYCHTNPGYASHWDADGGLPAEVDTIYNLWDKATDGDAGYASFNCSNINCHNGKATSATTNFTWYGSGTENCTLCHNDISDATAGTTGAAHDAHVGTPIATFGKVISCSSCHGGSPDWAGYSVPSNGNHIDGTFEVAGGSVIDGVVESYSGSYTDAATRIVGNCGTNLCHNNGKNAATPAYTWQTAISGCSACHGTDDTGLTEGHDGHLLASGTFGLAIGCEDCHDAVSASDMTGKTGHMDGTVTLAGATYSGGAGVLDVTVANTWGLCSSSNCHQAAPAAMKDSPAWNTTASGCSTCHGSTDATLTSGRHESHLPNAYIASQCGECHAANANNTSMAGQAAHINGTVNVGGSQTVSYSDPGCTNDCHLVNADTATYADWLDGLSLECTDCHISGSGTLAEGAGALPVSGLHNVTPTITGQRHDQSLGCANCHNALPGTHINNDFTGDTFANLGLQYYSQASADNGTCVNTSCHLGNANPDNGSDAWAHRWSSVAGAYTTDVTACTNCHGTDLSVANLAASGVNHRAVTDKHNTSGTNYTCKDCHAIEGAGYTFAWNSNDWGGGSNHGNSNIDINNNGTDYKEHGAAVPTTDDGLCWQCHKTQDGTYDFVDTSWTLNPVAGEAIGTTCGECHGTAGVNPSGESGAHIVHLSDRNDLSGSSGADCAPCHGAAAASYTNTIGGAHGDLSVTFSVSYSQAASRGNLTGTCSNVDCHYQTTTVAWNTSGTNTCTSCHNSGADTGSIADAWPASDKSGTAKGDAHGQHLGSTAYVIGSNCGDCHGDNTLGHSNAFNSSIEVNAGLTYSTGAGTCATNSCHGGTADFRDVTPGIACIDCHVSGKLADTKGALPASGLHAVTPLVTGQRHNETLGCANCHNALPGSHIDGTFTGDTVANLGLQYYSQSSANNGTCVNTSCHLGNANPDNGSDAWAHRWTSVAGAYTTDVTACANCHGTDLSVANLATGGVTHRAVTSTHNGITTNYACKDCHALEASSGYTFTWDSEDWNPDDTLSSHGDGSIQVNSNDTDYKIHNASAPTTDDGLCWQCHQSQDSTHDFVDTDWAVALVSGEGINAGCDTCHGNSGTGQIYPDGSGGSPLYVDDQGPGFHDEHLTAIVDWMDDGTKNDSATFETKNSSAACSYCHPDPGGVGHSNNGGSDNRVDLLVAGQFKYLTTGNPNGTGDFNFDTDGTCSTIKCHARAPFTPGWWGDSQAPGNVTLSITDGPEPNSLKITWAAPGDDGNTDGTAYRYDIRMGSDGDARYPGAAEASNFTRSDNFFGGPPTVKRQGDLQEAIARNLVAGQSYSFALRTYDETGTNFGTSNVDSRTVPADSVAPVLVGSPTWYGIDKATALDDGSVYITWTQAEDHTMPIVYSIFHSDTGSIDYPSGPQLTTKEQTGYRVSGLTEGIPVTFGVRACDSATIPNCDVNTGTLLASPKGFEEVPKTDVTYYGKGAASSGVVTMTTSDFSTPSVGTSSTWPVYFVAPTVYTGTTEIFASAFNLSVVNDRNPAGLEAELGTWNGSFQSFSTPLMALPVTAGKKAVRSIKFSFNGETRNVSSGDQLAVRFNVTSDALDSVSWGSSADRGDLSVAERPYNISPDPIPAVSASVSGKDVSIYWDASSDGTDGVPDTVHYDVYGDDGSGTFAHVIATDLTTNATFGSPLIWDTQKSGIALGGLNANVQVRVEAGDYLANVGTLSHTPDTLSGLSVDNSGDNDPPAQITNFSAETRPKQGSIYLSWTAPGDDADNNGRASYYDIRWAPTAIQDDTDFTNATPLDAEPFPTFGGTNQGMEVLDLVDGTDYFFGIKTIDDLDKVSPLSTSSPNALGGPKCGICHSTPPDEDASKGNHVQHGYTINDCSNCHGNDPSSGAQTFAPDHQDGEVLLGWKTATPTVGTYNGYEITYTQGGQTIYQDASGGGANLVIGDPGDQIDNGKCFSWSSLNVSGCHGPAPEADWQAGASLACSDCHGDLNRTVDSYGHPFDDPGTDIIASPPVDNHGYDGTGGSVVERKFVGAHEKHLNYSFRLSKGNSCRLCHQGSNHADGVIDVSLDLSAAGSGATWAPGASDAEFGSCGTMSPEACHPSASNPDWDSQLQFACVNCHGMDGTTPGHVTDPADLIDLPDNDGDTGMPPLPGNCTWCHIAGHPQERDLVDVTNSSTPVVTTVEPHYLTTGEKVTIHTQSGMTEVNNYTTTVTVIDPTSFSLDATDTSGYGTWDQGTFIQGNGWGIILVPNNSLVGINYKSGGVHLKAQVGSHGMVQSEAELCWSCHDANGISEWGADDGSPNNTDPGNGTDYDYGQTYSDIGYSATTTAWVVGGQGAWWRSGAGFMYKDSQIQSTHSTNPSGTAALSGSDYNYSEAIDPVGDIICSNCHDVHDLNMAPNDNPSDLPALDGQPYLRGTWKRNPYKEDGAPQSGTSYTAAGSGELGYGYEDVPRARSATTQEMGGYWIDQNSGNPTAGWSYSSSAGLCMLCHQNNVDELNQFDDNGAAGLWLANNNGHANAAIGGSGSGAANIFRTGFDGTYGFGRQGTGGADEADPNPGGWMGFQNTQATAKTPEDDAWGYGPRSQKGGYLLPNQTSGITLPNLLFAWGVAVDATTTEIGVHQFSCSKCHNPHASRLPKLMITNCLDVSHNAWDNDYSGHADWGSFNGTTSSWGTNRISHLSTAQNCHRYVDVNGDNNPDEQGWNKVTPW